MTACFKKTKNNPIPISFEEASTAGDTIPDLTTGSLWRNIWQLSWPMLLIMIFNFLVGFVDVYVAGFISPEVQAAVGYVSLLYFFVIIIANAISIGTVALVSRAIGGGDFTRALEVARQSLIFGSLVAAVLTLVGIFFSREIVAAAGFPEKIREISETLLRIFSIALGANYLLIISSSLFRASGDILHPLFTMFVVSAVNILGEFVLVFGWFSFPRMGYAGIGVATAVAVTLGMGINLILFFRTRWRSIYKGSWTLSLETMKTLLDISWPAAMLQIAWNSGTIILYNLLGRLGEESITAMAAISNGLRIEALIFLPAFALNMSASVLIGQNLGAGNPERAERGVWRIAAAGVVTLSALAFVVFLQAETFAALVAKDPAVLAETARYLRINMIAQPFIALSLSVSGGLHGAGDTKGTMWVIIIAMWLIRLPLTYALAFPVGWGATGVWWAMVISMVCQSVLMAGRFHAGKWKHLKLE
jgi:MATE family multidrug resistance protein